MALGICPHGQGERTTFAQIVADQLGVPIDDVEIHYGDTERTPMGWGSYGSRSTPVGSGALMGAIEKIKEKAKTVTAHLLEAAVEDIEYGEGKFFVQRCAAKSKTIQEVALDGQRGLESTRRGSSRASRPRPSSIRRTSSIRSAPTSPWSAWTRRRARSASSATLRSTTAAR